MLLVDDELLSRTHLKLLVKWEEHGYTLAGEASNGREALQFLEEGAVDIVISDIRMPEMDGVALSSEKNRRYPDIPIIMLSNYDEFELVRGALRNGAVDYLLKHRLNASMLLETLDRAKAQVIEARSKLREPGQIRPRADQLHALREKFVIQLLSGYVKSEEAEEHLRLLQMRLDTKHVQPVVMEIDGFQEIVASRGLKEESILQFAITNIVEEILQEYDKGIISHLGNGKFILLLSFTNTKSKAFIDQFIQGIIDRSSVCLKKFVKVSASFAIGKPCVSILEVGKSYEQAVEALREKFYLGKSSVVRGGAAKFNTSPMLSLDPNDELRLIASVKSLNRDDVSEILERIFSQIKGNMASPVRAKMVFSELISTINRLCKEYHLDMAELYDQGEVPHEVLARLETLNEIKAWICTVFDRLLTMLACKKNENLSISIQQAVHYINHHYCEDISLSDVASAIAISNNYLSSQFKEEMGISLTEFISDLRVNKAKLLLAEGKMDLKQVSQQCGFNSYTYFLQVFKKKTGMTPKEFLRHDA
ncbi:MULTISPECIES: response regulator [unclassified Paenibacillus]|uniref:response regulator n=1 Tax=unclassified Paenibacillus TaxID=185978 RepID=UPI001F1A5FD2|nr:MULTISPECIES: response regulator [unclassified Paenibacillus]